MGLTTSAKVERGQQPDRRSGVTRLHRRFEVGHSLNDVREKSKKGGKPRQLFSLASNGQRKGRTVLKVLTKVA